MTATPSEFAPNFAFQNGSLWLPTRNRVTNTTLKPSFLGGDFGSMMPYVRLNIPEIWDSVVIPFENIVSFEYDVFASGASQISFLDQTPIFIQEITRKTWNKNLEKQGEFYLELEFGWRIQNQPEGIREQMGDDGLFITDKIQMWIAGVSYKYTNFGVLCTINMDKRSDIVSRAFTTKVGEIDITKSLGSHAQAENAIQTIINNSVRNSGVEFFVKILSPEIDINGIQNVKMDGTKDVKSFLWALNNAMKIPNSKREDPYGSPQLYMGEKKVKINTGSGSKELYPIYFYHPANTSGQGSWIPQIEYPSNENSIVGWNPELNAQAGSMWTAATTTKVTDSAGNEKEVSRETQPSPAGHNAPNATSGDNTPQVGSNNTIGSQPLKRVVIPRINVDMMGDPTFMTINMMNTTVNVLHNAIEQDGILRDGSSFFENFKGVTPVLRDRLSNISGIPYDDSPFNGEYLITGIKHKISTSISFATSLTLEWKNHNI